MNATLTDKLTKVLDTLAASYEAQGMTPDEAAIQTLTDYRRIATEKGLK